MDAVVSAMFNATSDLLVVVCLRGANATDVLGSDKRKSINRLSRGEEGVRNGESLSMVRDDGCSRCAVRLAVITKKDQLTD